MDQDRTSRDLMASGTHIVKMKVRDSSGNTNTVEVTVQAVPIPEFGDAGLAAGLALSCVAVLLSSRKKRT